MMKKQDQTDQEENRDAEIEAPAHQTFNKTRDPNDQLSVGVEKPNDGKNRQA